MAVKAIKAGATDFVFKPWKRETFSHFVFIFFVCANRLIRLKHWRLRIKKSTNPSTKIQRHYRAEREHAAYLSNHRPCCPNRCQRFDFGETEPEKNLVARAIHSHSARKTKHLVQLIWEAVTKLCLKANFLGTKRLFTDAKEDLAGRFELANNGTLFWWDWKLIDAASAKLLTAIQNRRLAG